MAALLAATNWLDNLPAIGGVGTIMVLLFRSFWRGEARDERRIVALEKTIERLEHENANLRHDLLDAYRTLQGLPPLDPEEDLT